MKAFEVLSWARSLTSLLFRLHTIQLLEPRTFTMNDMIKLGLNRSISPEQVVQMEHDILFTLEWDVFPSTSIEFAYYMICMLPPEVPKSIKYALLELSRYLSELAICVYKFVGFSSSVKALAIVCVAIDSLDASSATISTESQCTFALRIYDTLGLWAHDDENIAMLKEELNHLIHHNTNLDQFVRLILSSHKDEANTSGSPKSTAVNVSAST